MLACKVKSRFKKRSLQQAKVVKNWADRVFGTSSGRKRSHSARVQISCVKKLARHQPGVQQCKVAPSLKLVFRDGKKREALSAGHTLAIAYDKPLTLSAMASKHDVDLATVRRTGMIVSAAYLSVQQRMLACISEALQRIRPAFVIVHMAWGETGEKLAAIVGGKSVPSTYQVMVSRIKLEWGWEHGSAPMSLDVVMPPAFVLTTSAAKLHAALHNGPFTKPIHEAICKMLSSATLAAIVLRECDAASSNDKLFHHALGLDAAGVLHDAKLCGLHQTHLILTAAVQLIGTM
jgi:hypothetical protein